MEWEETALEVSGKGDCSVNGAWQIWVLCCSPGGCVLWACSWAFLQDWKKIWFPSISQDFLEPPWAWLGPQGLLYYFTGIFSSAVLHSPPLNCEMFIIYTPPDDIFQICVFPRKYRWSIFYILRNIFMGGEGGGETLYASFRESHTGSLARK